MARASQGFDRRLREREVAREYDADALPFEFEEDAPPRENRRNKTQQRCGTRRVSANGIHRRRNKHYF